MQTCKDNVEPMLENRRKNKLYSQRGYFRNGTATNIRHLWRTSPRGPRSPLGQSARMFILDAVLGSFLARARVLGSLK
ncbi:hypothetical protein ANAPC5_01148 [Anaplasma phagocytophilum]|nr:hypothetical protein ANAPC5_01148 [Anaplasma phagocytophilum]